MRIWVISAIPYVWVVVALAFLSEFAASFARQGLPVLFPFIQEEFDASRAQLGLITSGVIFGGAGIILVLGWLIDRMGARHILSVALIVVAVGVLLFSQIQSLTQAVLLSLLIGAAGSATAPGPAKAIMDWARPQIRGLSMGIKETSVPFSGIIVAGTLPVLALAFGWRTAVIILAVTIALSGVVFFALYRDRPSSALKREGRSLLGSIALLAKNRNIWFAAWSTPIHVALHLVFVSYVILFLKEDLGMSTEVAARFLAIGFVGGIVGRVFWGMVSDLLGGRRVVVLVFLHILSMIGMMLMVWLPSDASSVVVALLVFAIGATALGSAGVLGTLVIELGGPGLAATGFGFVAIISLIGALIPPIFGLIVDLTGSYDIGWWMMAGLASVGALMMSFVRQHPHVSVSPPSTGEG